MPDRLFLGLDGGQTSTLSVLCDGQGRLLGVGHAGPSNHVHEPGGMERLERALREGVTSAFAAAGLPVAPLAAACCGMTGGEPYVAGFMAAIVPVGRLVVEHDSVTAHAGALAGEPGAMVIAGTGSVALAVNEAGERARVGGWAWLMGDEGSGFDLGRQALIAAARAADGRGPQTRLLGDVLARFGANDLWALKPALLSLDRAEVAALALLTVAAAAAGDAVAQRIVERGTDELAQAAAISLRRVGLDAQLAPVATVGGLWRAGEPVLAPFRRHLAERAPGALVRPPRYSPALGAALLALRAGGVFVDEGVRAGLDEAARTLAGEK